MFRVFINYRTDDEADIAALIKNDLSHRFGPAKIFRASESIRPGDDFERELMRTVRRSDVLLAVIGPKWLDMRDDRGNRKIDDESDWTRREILEAFACDVRVVPVLIGSVGRLSAADLPEELAKLAVCQYTRFHHRGTDKDLSLLAGTLADLVPELAHEAGTAGAPAETGPVDNDASGGKYIVQGRDFTGDFTINNGDGASRGDRRRR